MGYIENFLGRSGNEAKKFSNLLVFEFFFLLYEVTRNILLREPVYYAVDAARVNVLSASLSLKYVLAEEVVLAWDDTVML